MTQPAEAPAPVVVAATPAPAAPGPGTSGAAAPPETSHQDRVATLHKLLAEKDNAGPAVGDEPKVADESATADADKPKDDADGKPKVDGEPKRDEAPKDPKLAAKFAALASQKKEIVEGRSQLDAKARAVAEREQGFTQYVTKTEQAFAAREAKIREREEGDHKLLADNPEKLFQHLIALGIDSDEKMKAIGERQWAAHRAKFQAAEVAKPKEPEDPADKPLTLKEWQRLQAEQAQATQIDAKVSEYVAGFDEAKHEAAIQVFTKEDRIREGEKIARGLIANGKTFTHDDIREAVNTLAENDDRWQRYQKRVPQVPGATSPKIAEGASAPKVSASSARQSPQGPKTLSNDAVTETSPPATDDRKPATNGSSALPYKERRKAHLARITQS